MWRFVGGRRRVRSYADVVASTDGLGGDELVVAGDGSIPAEQLARLGLRPGSHLRIVAGVAHSSVVGDGASATAPALGELNADFWLDANVAELAREQGVVPATDWSQYRGPAMPEDEVDAFLAFVDP